MSFEMNVIPMEGMRNIRDFGGIKTMDGRTIKSHRIIRSEYLHRITENDARHLQEYGLKYVIDLRGPGECKYFPDRKVEGVTECYCPLSVEDNLTGGRKYPHKEYHSADKDILSLVEFLFTRSPKGDSDEIQTQTYSLFPVSPNCIAQFRNIFSLYLNNRDGAILFHCTDGKDRTGATAILLLSALGVDEETIRADYLATNDLYADRVKYRDELLHKENDMEEELIQSILKVTGVTKEWYDAFMNSIHEHYGTVLDFLKGPVGLTDKDIQSLRDNYLE